MKINILPASKMRDVDNVCFSGSNYVIKRRYHIAYRYTFKGRTHEEAKASLLAKDGLFGFNTTHNSRTNGFFTPKSPDNIILDFGENHEIRPKDEATAQCVLYFSNSPQHTALLDTFSNIKSKARIIVMDAPWRHPLMLISTSLSRTASRTLFKSCMGITVRTSHQQRNGFLRTSIQISGAT